MHDKLATKKLKLGVSSDLLGENYQLLKSHPVLCGLIAYSLKVRYHELGVAFANAWGSLLYTYHLYNAVRQERLLPQTWQDMEILMNAQEVFMDDRPANFDDYHKWFALSIGVSATAFAKKKRPGPLPATKGGPRRMLKEVASTSLMFKDRFCNDSGRNDLSLQDLQCIIARSSWKREEIDGEPGLLSLTRESKKEQAAKAKERRTTYRPTAQELLETLRNTIHSEKMELDLDYLLMHRTCWKLLRQVQKDCDPKLREIFGPGYLKESQLPFVVGYIFMAPTQMKRLSMQVKKSDFVTNRLLQQAAMTMQGYIKLLG